MATEKIYVLGATGNIGECVVKTLLKANIPTTVYVRDPAKAQSKFGDNSSLTVVKGDYENIDGFKNSIGGHSRLFLLVTDLYALSAIKAKFTALAYEAGVEQVVDISSSFVTTPWRSTFIGTAQRFSEEAILAIPNRGCYVTLRPTQFMTNMLRVDLFTIKSTNTIYGAEDGDTDNEWISTDDIADLAVRVLTEPIEKHADAVYEMIGDRVSHNERARLLTAALGKTITYKKVDPQERYDTIMSTSHLPHLMVYDFLSFPPAKPPTFGLKVVLGRQPQTLKEWIEANKSKFL